MSDPHRNLHNEEIERALLGSVLIYPEAYVLEDFMSVPVEAFYRDRHKVIAAAMRRMLDVKEDIDLVNVCENLRKHGELEQAGSVAYIAGVAGDGNTQNTQTYANSLRELHQRRRLVDFAGETMLLARNQATPLPEVLGRVEQDLTRVARNAEDGRSIDGYADAALDAIDGDSGGHFKTGIVELDDVTGGLKGLVVLGARPSMGKSSLARDILRHLHKQGRKVALFTQDQYGSDVLSFEASFRSRVTLQKIKGKTAHPHEVQRWRDSVREIREEYRDSFVIDDRPHNIYALANRIRAAARWGAELVAVDYLQLIDVPGAVGQNTVQATTLVSKTLKHLTQELGMPILALAQLSRAVEMRNPPVPQLSDLRESGQIEQDAEAVIFLYRREYYEARSQGRGEALESAADLVVAKNKTGPTGTARVPFNSRYVTFRPQHGHNI
jgi:replicative DNA helicase